MDDSAQLRLWIFGFQISQALHVAARIGLADLLDDQALEAASLAERAGCNADGLSRLLRALCGIGVFAETAEGFIHTSLSRRLRRDHPQSHYLAAAVYGVEHYQAWGDLLAAVQSGEPVFEHRFGHDYYTYLENLAHTCEVQRDYQQRDESVRKQALGEHYSTRELGALVEVDGLGGPVPHDADTYLLSHRLHRFDDAPALALLVHCRQAMPTHSRLLVVELMLREQPGFDPGRWMDLNSLLLCAGRERTQAQYLALAREAGFTCAAAQLLRNGMTVLELHLAKEVNGCTLPTPSK